ncbi:hypothetical protein O181_054808 [Austropuccinia psidii MF-1]|uniref:Uncharacterized protein n=1 Tax=Austropuccinia psidii MF-1 TaxID=1389203 RepID=A0A9Q3HRS9_9BASI|nr:hypothetical protein [Austropuccinia psidii MF-1]
MLTRLHCPSDGTLTKTPHLYPPHSLRSCSALLTCLQCCPHTGLILNAAYDHYAPAAPSICDYDSSPPSPPSALLMLVRPFLIFSTSYNSYAPAAPSRYASNTTLNPLCLIVSPLLTILMLRY